MNRKKIKIKKRKKKCFTIILEKNMNNLHFIPNNIFIKFFKKLTKYKNDYQQYLNYIMHFIIYF